MIFDHSMTNRIDLRTFIKWRRIAWSLVDSIESVLFVCVVISDFSLLDVKKIELKKQQSDIGPILLAS